VTSNLDAMPQGAYDYKALLAEVFGADSPQFLMCVEAIDEMPGQRASRGKHHDFIDGLLVHTLEVLFVADGLARSAGGGMVNRTVVAAAAVFHDLAKVHDYTIGAFDEKRKTFTQYTEHHKLVGHLPASYRLFMERSAGMDEEWRMDVSHAILAHHGRKDWGSPLEPVTREAWIVHLADMFSCKVMADRTDTA